MNKNTEYILAIIAIIITGIIFGVMVYYIISSILEMLDISKQFYNWLCVI